MQANQPRLCLFTQTPPVRFLREVPPGRSLEDYRAGQDFEVSPGGVTRMVAAFLARSRGLGRMRSACWISLARCGPDRLAWGPGVGFEQVRLEPDAMARYAAAKDALWRAVHALPPPEHGWLARDELERGLGALARSMGRRFRSLHAQDPFDVAYVHDFQLLPLAAEIPREMPRLFRWHIPFPEEHFVGRELVVDWLNRFDAVIASTPAYAGAMRRAGVRVPVHALPPYLDERRRRVVHPADLEQFEHRWGLSPEDVVFLLVARMDPMKSQDVAIRALARILDPSVKLVLVGSGGFSGGRRGGLGLAFASEWREYLEAIATKLGVQDRVVFTGGLPDEDLDVAITRSRALLLPSRLEGFGLAAIEAWLYGRPVLVSRGTGVAELVREGRDGYSFEPGDVFALAEHMRLLAEDAELARRLGDAGRRSARACYLGPGSDAVWSVLSTIGPPEPVVPTEAGE